VALERRPKPGRIGGLGNGEGAGRLEQATELAPRDVRVELFLVVEVVVERTLRDARCLDDAVERRRTESVDGELVERGAKNGLLLVRREFVKTRTRHARLRRPRPRPAQPARATRSRRGDCCPWRASQRTEH